MFLRIIFTRNLSFRNTTLLFQLFDSYPSWNRWLYSSHVTKGKVGGKWSLENCSIKVYLKLIGRLSSFIAVFLNPEEFYTTSMHISLYYMLITFLYMNIENITCL